MFVVATVFKNEAPLLREWVEHYLLREGAVHLFMVDHGSTDEPKARVFDYADRITWFEDARPFEPGVQTLLLNEHVLPKVAGGKCWVLVCDVDEYLYAPAEPTVAQVLRAMPEHVRRVWVPWKVFGGNGHRAAQPAEGVVRGFTRRAEGVSLPYKCTAPGRYEAHLGLGKMLARGVARLGVHESEAQGQNSKTVYGWDRARTPAHLLTQLPRFPILELNHYMYMSRAYYEEVKCRRGGGQTGHGTGKYTLAYYDATEPGCNAVQDQGLALKAQRRAAFSSHCNYNM